MNDTPLDPKKSFDIIDSIIAESQKQNHDNGFYFGRARYSPLCSHKKKPY